MFPMIRTRLLKVLRVKVGKSSMERTGHLGAVDLVFINHVDEHKEVRGKCIAHKMDHVAPTEVSGQSKGF